MLVQCKGKLACGYFIRRNNVKELKNQKQMQKNWLWIFIFDECERV